MMSLSDDNQSENIEALNSTSRYLDDLFTGDNHVTCLQFSKPDVATLSYRRSHYWWQKER